MIAGKPNAGKSSLLNRLVGDDIAIVTDVPGTTRDVLRHPVQIDGLPLNLIDTAGLRTAADIVEEEGIRRARAEIRRADRVLYVVDAAEGGADPKPTQVAQAPGHAKSMCPAGRQPGADRTPSTHWPTWRISRP